MIFMMKKETNASTSMVKSAATAIWKLSGRPLVAVLFCKRMPAFCLKV